MTKTRASDPEPFGLSIQAHRISLEFGVRTPRIDFDEAVLNEAAQSGRLDPLPANHSPFFTPVLHPTLRASAEAMLTAASVWLSPQFGSGMTKGGWF